jgi:hypothetical protein
VILNMRRWLQAILFVSICLLAARAHPGETKTLFKAEFNDLNAWSPSYLEGAGTQATYNIVRQRAESLLEARSGLLASAIEYKAQFNVYVFPTVRWQWKVEPLDQRQGAETNTGDYPLSIFVVFQRTIERRNLWQILAYGPLQLFFGEGPPPQILRYVWVGTDEAEAVPPVQTSARVGVIPLETGNAKAGQWVTEEVNLLADYERTFGGKPPTMVSIGLLSNGGSPVQDGIAYLRFIEVYGPE